MLKYQYTKTHVPQILDFFKAMFMLLMLLQKVICPLFNELLTCQEKSA